MGIEERLDRVLEERGLAAVWFARPNAFAWLTRGGDNLVDRAAAVGEAAVGYDGDGLSVVANDIEAPRLRAEELPADATVESFPWYRESLAAAVADLSPSPAAADFDVPGFEGIDAQRLRQPLTDRQVDTYRTVASDTAEAVESVARSADAGATERSVAADLRHALTDRGLSAPVVLVGGSDRAPEYRHYTPTAAPLGDYALLSVTAERAGLSASCTRTVAFDPPAWLRDRTRVAMRVEATALAATREAARDGGTAGDVFGAIQDAYAALGWDGEWRNHHQGGAAGYAGREWIATPGHDAPVQTPMGYAWNPTVRGAKSEDTCLVTDDGVEVLTATAEWPTERVGAVGRELQVDRHAVLES